MRYQRPNLMRSCHWYLNLLSRPPVGVKFPPPKLLSTPHPLQLGAGAFNPLGFTTIHLQISTLGVIGGVVAKSIGAETILTSVVNQSLPGHPIEVVSIPRGTLLGLQPPNKLVANLQGAAVLQASLTSSVNFAFFGLVFLHLLAPTAMPPGARSKL